MFASLIAVLSDLAQQAADDVLASPQQLVAHVAMIVAVDTRDA